MNNIPVVDLADHRDPDPETRGRFARALRTALQDFGFVRVEGHGVEPDLVQRVYDHFERFFSRPNEDKLACSGVAGGQRGFTPFGVEHAKGHPAPDLKEFFHIGQSVDQAGASESTRPQSAYPENVWPKGEARLRADGLALFRALEDCAARILEALADGFELPRDVFAEMVIGGNSILRAAHYPPISPDCDSNSVRAAAHEDINLITLLCEATDSGLEILPPGSDRWLPVECPPGQIIVDSGDMLSRMTNDVVPSTTHRVVNPPGAADRHRYSLPFFAHPRPDSDLSVLPRFVSDERPRRYPPITAGDFLAERLREIGLAS